MSILKKVVGIGLVGFALALSVPAEAKDEPAPNPLTEKKGAANKSTTKKRPTNRLSTRSVPPEVKHGALSAGNSLSANKLSTNKNASNTTAASAGDGAFTDVAAVDLPNGTRFTR